MNGLFLCLLSALLAYASEAGFDCQQATSPTEKKICDSPALSGLDRILNDAYKMKTKSQSEKAAKQLRKEQASWISSRDQCIEFLPAEGEQCLYDSYHSRLKQLGAIEEVLSFYRTRCQTEDWECRRVGILDIELARWDDAVKDLSAFCERDYDGDGGESCFLKAKALEQLGKRSEALAVAKKACEKRQNNEACAMASRLGGKKSNNPWVGLYRNSTGTLLVEEAAGGKVSLSADTTWANGHQCGWSLVGKINGKDLIAEKDAQAPECAPLVSKRGRNLVVKDPNYKCKVAYCGARAVYEGTFELDR